MVRRHEEIAERWRRIAALVEMALGLERPLREAYLAQLAASDGDLVRQVRVHLQRHEAEEEGTAEPEMAAAEAGERSRQPDRVGPYRILSRIGQGGMGQVFLAERSDGEIERRVAIKIIGTGFDLPIVHQRFLSERQILAGFDHPYIARLYDAGTTDDGRPYLVMEAVEGRPIDRYCAEERLTLEGRLRLFRRVCEAVEHAHRRLVVHRDLKPSNILVTADGTPKLLDFGIAKLLDPDSFPLPLDEVTRTAMRPLTPRWASPEQVRGRTITTASDVWTLGVLLHRLLTGGHPHEPQSTEPDALLEAMERAPEAASRTLRRRLEAGEPVPWPDFDARRLVRRLEGDLDAIVAQALRVEPDARYPSVSALDDDVRRLLDGEPVRATRSTALYRLGKFLRRYKAGVLATVAVLVVALSFAVVSRRQAAAISEEAERAERTRDFLADLLGTADARERRQGNVSLHQILREGVRRVDTVAGEDPLVRFRLFATLSEAQLNVGAAGDALTTLAAGLDALEVCEECSKSELAFANRLIHESMRSDLAAARDLVPRLHDLGLIERVEVERLTRNLNFIEGRMSDIVRFSSVDELSLDDLVEIPGELRGLGVGPPSYAVLPKLLRAACVDLESQTCLVLVHYLATYFADVGDFEACRVSTEWASDVHLETVHRYDPRLVFARLARARCANTMESAERWADDALASTLERIEVDPLSTRTLFQRGLAPLRLAEAAARLGDAETQVRSAEEAIELFEALRAQESIIFVDSAYAQALLLAGRTEEARPVVHELVRRRWRSADLEKQAAEAGVLPSPMPPRPTLEELIAPEVLEWIDELPRSEIPDPTLEALVQRLESLDETVISRRSAG